MKKTITLKKTLLITGCILAVTLFLNSCGITQSLFSKGRSEFSLANDEINKGNGLKALDHAFNAVIIDPEVRVFKKFMYIHFNATLSKTDAFLSSSKNTKIITQAEKRVATYQLLESVFSKLKQVDLPFVHPKGKWEWTAKFVDYSEQTKESTEYAFKLIMKQGKVDIDKSLIKDSYEKLSKAYNKYCSSDKRISTAQKITTYYTDFASLKEKGTDVPTLELAYEAWGYALIFTPTLTKARDSKDKLSTKIAGIYYKKGLKLLASKNVADNIKSVDQFKLTLKWNCNHADAKNSIDLAKDKIANFYYDSAVKMEKTSKSEKAKIIALYRSAQKWIPNFKDSMYRIYSLNVGSELITLKQNLAETRKQYTALTNRINTVSGAVNKGYAAMEAITYLSGQTRSLNTKMKNVESTLKAFTLIPIVGTVSGFTAKSLSIAQKPIGGLVNKFNAIERPFITPTKSAVEQGKNTVDAIKGMVVTTKIILENTEKTVAGIDDCIKSLELESDFKKVEGAIKEVNKGLSGTAMQMRNLNNSLSNFEKGAKALAVLNSPAQKIKNGLRKIKPTLDKANKVTHEMDKVLKKEIGFTGPISRHKYKMSLYKALTAGGVVARKIAGLGMKIAKPIMKKMKISFPTVPGVDELREKLDVIKNEYEKIKTETSKIKESYQKYTSFESLISKNVNKIVETTGCGNRIGTIASK
ncbi:hypothetical protein ACXR6G_11025 [Ancylomarina sp. YFZ004]